MKRRRFLGIVLTACSTLLLVPTVLVVLAPIFAHMFFNGYYILTLNTRAAQELAVIAMFGGGGLVGGIWILTTTKAQL
jgi:hypothetical protein